MKPSLALAVPVLALAACSDPPQREPIEVGLVWRVERGDVAARAGALAARLGAPAPVAEGTELIAEGTGVRLRVDYATGRARVYLDPPRAGVVGAMTDDRAIDAAADYLHELGRLPTDDARCLCAAGITDATDAACAGIPVADPAGRSAWKTCPTLAVRVIGMASDLLPADAVPPRLPEPERDPDPDAGDPPALVSDDVEIAFTPRLPIVRAADGTVTYGEIAGGHADVIVRLDATGAITAVDDRFQPPAAAPIAVPLRARAEIEDELETDLAAWQLGFFSRGLVTQSDHDNIPHPLTFYYPLYLQTLAGTNVVLRSATATTFLPRVIALELPETYDVSFGPTPAIWFDASTGSSAPTVTWVLRDGETGRRTLGETVAEADPAHLGSWVARLPTPPPDGYQHLSLEVRDAAGFHYALEDYPMLVEHSPTERADLHPRNMHLGQAWTDCGPLSWCHSSNLKVTAVCLTADCKTGPVGVKVEMAGPQPPGSGRFNDVFIRDLALMQFHLDLKLRLPEKKRNLANGWAEDWPRPGDPDAVTIGMQRYKDFWIRTDTCKFEGASTYSCAVVPNTRLNPQPDPANPHRKLGLRCPADLGHPKEQGDEADKTCTEPTKVPGGFTMRRVFTGLPGRLTINAFYDVTTESTGPAMSAYMVDLANGTVLRLVKAGTTTDFDPTTTQRTADLLKKMGALAPAVKPRINWKWEGDQPRATPDAMKRYGGMNAECYNVLEFCRQANQYDPRPLPWNHNGAVLRPEYIEASTGPMLRPWETGQQATAPLPANDRLEGRRLPYCPHELYKVLKERFCPCPDDGTPCQATGGDAAARPNPPIQVVEVRLGLYERMVPFERGNSNASLISEMKSLPEMMMALEGHDGAKAWSAVPEGAYINNVGAAVKSYARWMGFMFPALALGAWAGALGAQVGFDAAMDWLDVFHWVEPMASMALVRPQSNVTPFKEVRGFVNTFYNANLGVLPQYVLNAPIPPPGTIGWGDKTKFARLVPPVGNAVVPPAFYQQGFWQNIHFKSLPADGSVSTTSWVIAPGCQSLFPIRKVVNNQGGWFWSWDRNLCVHHHESWFNNAPKQSNHDIAWILGARTSTDNPDRVGATYANSQLRVPPTPPATNTRVNSQVFWEFTVGRTDQNADVTTMNTEFFFTQGPTGW